MISKKNHCPNCGSLIQSDQCRYCGAVFLDWSIIDMDKPVFMKFRMNGRIFRAKCIMNRFDISNFEEDTSYYCTENKYQLHKRFTPHTIDISLNVIPVNNIEFLLIEEDVVDPDDLKEYWKDGNQNDK